VSPHDLWIAAAAYVASILTLMTGFGLGTILTPVTALFYDVKLAILIVAIVHILNNALKLWLFRAHVDRAIFRRFGALSIAGAVAGALLQSLLVSSVVTVILGIVLVALGAGEFLPRGAAYRFPRSLDPVGGFASGLLGGLVGNQGAIRSAYLLNYDIPKESFIATAAMIALVIDATRIPIYLTAHRESFSQISWSILPVVLLAFLGTITGKKFLASLSGEHFKKAVAAAVVVMGLLFITGVL
jgi:uncharacterized membrane protein YfcA